MVHQLSARRLVVGIFIVCLALSAAVLQGNPADAAHDRNGEPVDGRQQAYHPSGPGRPAPTTVDPDFFFHGSKPGATFDAQEPAGPQKTQDANVFANEDVPGDENAVFWQGDYSGTLDGALHFQWYWSGNPEGSLINVDAIVTIFGDVTPNGEEQKNKIIGRSNVNLRVGTVADPQENINTIAVDGVVADNILIQVVPRFFDSGTLLQAHYDAPSVPGGFEVLSAAEAPSTPQNAPADYNGEPFRVQAVNVGRDAAEPTIGITKDGTAFYAAGAFDALPNGSPAQLARTKVLRSRDGGLNWESIQPPLAGVTTDPPTTLDPFVWVDEETGRVFNPELYLLCSTMHYSDDGGETYESTNRAACGEFVNDHQTVFTGPPPPNLKDRMEGYPNVLYYCFNRIIDSNCGRSLDGGESFEPVTGKEPDDPFGAAFVGFDPGAGGLCGGLHGHGDTDSEGRVFIPKGHCGFPWVSISEDGGETWKKMEGRDLPGIQVSDKISAAGPHLAVATDAADNVYMVWWDKAEHLPYLAISTDHGNTWSKPLMIAPPGVKEVNFPVIEAGDEGRIAINFPGTTVGDQDDHKRPWNQYIVASTNALADNPLFVSTTANPVNDPIHRGDCLGRCAGMFDFLDIQISRHDGDIWATATDTCTNDDEEGEPASEDVNCVKNPDNLDGNGGKSPNVSNDEEGYAIRQLSGPTLLDTTSPRADGRGGDGDVTADGFDDDGDGGVGDTGGGPTLPATGGGVGLILLGAAAMPAAVLLRRRRS